MMTAHELIEAYVTDVAVLLPRRQRNDVAFELRALLHEELQAQVPPGAQADAAQALALLQAFGRPREVAARYRPTLTIIAPEDGQPFVRAVVIGLAVIWAAGLLAQLSPGEGAALGLLQALGRWWGATVIPSLAWPGLLVTGYGLAAWARRRWPATAPWSPRAPRPACGGRVSLALAIVAILVGVQVLMDPRWMLDVFWHGRAAPAAYDALTYTAPFLQRQAPWLLVLLLLNVPLLLARLVAGRRTDTVHGLETGLALLTCAAMVWTVLDGPVFMTAASDQTTKAALVIITVYTLVDLLVQRWRAVRPSPAL